MTEPFVQLEDEGILWINKWMKDTNIVAGFTTREGGYSIPPYESNNMGFHVEDDPAAVLTNRKKLADTISLPLNKWVVGEQVHGNEVQIIDTNDRASGAFTKDNAIPEIDGLITKEKDIVCAALFADCVPLFFADKKKGIVGISHAGWKGTVANIANKTVERFKDLSSDPKDIEVVIGPSISKDNYQVNDHVIRHIDPKYADCYEGENGQYQLDLQCLNNQLLLDAGISPGHIHKTAYCTYHHSAFFSHRRDQHPTGRMLGFIALR
ncbi:peptidoglycan editing factor PgeF [Gracilibacillus sp. S3-1-1]|uniref:Peptidoglycan editing factor PgeF n=1 Tax=Gracilibacillus pellucidus TaxID=3095368 RepID=A0ACC6M223_9BACI|nr:peptidoglycan editing factor PgeF [Gracilibacillus sp. S3-1-1]MDX8044941.1 peptidoglycan editing factor PgeF [Gracilibacillus sp. S3-1-1]